MKIRTDFVTNSSSASFKVELQLKNDRDEMVTFSASTARDSKWGGHEEYYDGSGPYSTLFRHGWTVKALDIDYPGSGDEGIFLYRRPLSEMTSLEEVIEDLLRLVEVTTYDDGIVAQGFRFFVAGNPTYYDSREDLEKTIKRLGGEVTGPYDADLVVYCGKERFCERWPEGHAYLTLSEAEQAELDDAERDIIREMREAARAFDGDTFTFGIHTGSCDMEEEVQAEAEDGWKGWILYEWMHNLFTPILSEREFALFDPHGPAGNGGPSAMPGAVKALAKRCAERGITMDNLRIIGAKVISTPFGDSVWEVDDFARQWDMNVSEGEWDYEEIVTRRAGSLENRGDIYDVDTSWRDTAWWPFTGKARGVPYSSVTSGAIEKDTVNHLDLSELDGTHITSMSEWFDGFESLQDLDLSHLDTSQVTDMSWMFAECHLLRTLDLSHLDTSQVRDMSGMFYRCKALEDLDVSGFDTANVTDMRCMFEGCCELRELDLSGFDTSRVSDMRCMFEGCHELRVLDLSGFDTSRVTSMSEMFEGCCELRELDLSSFATSQVTSMSEMFWRCQRLRCLDLSAFDTSRLRYAKRMFGGCNSLERWVASETWPVGLEGAIPEPTAARGKWWSERDGAWMSVDEIRKRGPMADTYTSYEPEHVR